MKNLLLLFVFFLGIASYGQRSGNVVIYSNTGEKFYVILNGIRQNNTPETNVKIEGLTDQWYSCKVISANNTFTLEKNIGVKPDTVITYRIIEKKGKYKFRFYTETSMGTAPSNPEQTTITYSPVEIVETNTNGGGTGSTEVIETTTTTTTTSTEMSGNNGGSTETVTTNTSIGNENGGTETISIDINVNENGMSTNMNVTGTEGTGETINSTTTTTTNGGNGSTYYEETTTTTTGGGNGTSTYYEETTTTTTTTTTTSGTEGNIYQDDEMTVTMNNNTTNCFMSDTDFQALKTSVANESFPEDQRRVANTAAKSKCMSVAQIKEIAALFSFADDQMSFIKTAYDNCNNKGDYYQLMDVFTFSDDKEELEKFLNSK